MAIPLLLTDDIDRKLAEQYLGADSKPVIPARRIVDVTPPEIKSPAAPILPIATAPGPKPIVPLGTGRASGAFNQPNMPEAPRNSLAIAPDLGNPLVTTPPNPFAPTPNVLAKPTRKESDEASKREYALGMPSITAHPATDFETYEKQKRAQNIFKQEHPMGSDISSHPGIGGKILHGLGQVASVLGAGTIPGTSAYRDATIRNEGNNIAGEDENAFKKAQTKNVLSEANLRDHPLPTTKTPDEATFAYLTGQIPGADGKKIDTPLPFEQALEKIKNEKNTPEAKKSEFFTLPDGSTAQGYTQNGQGFLSDGTPLPKGATPYAKPADTGRDPITDAIGGRPTKGADGSFTFAGKKYPTEATANQAYGDAYEAKKRQEIAAGKPTPEPKGDMFSATVNGRQVAGTLEQMKALGVKPGDMEKVSTENASKIENARTLYQWMNSTDPEDPGVLTLAQKLDKEGKLGPLASRYQDWINKTGSVLGFDSGDPDFQRLMTDMGLETTALMQVHVGSRGGSALMEHFQDLANAKTMSGKAFLSALDAENRYIRRKALMSGGAGGGATNKSGAKVNADGYPIVSPEE
jgi:hypothetical protein